jgi:archaellum component FlaC
LQHLRGRLSEDDLEGVLDELDDAVEEVEDDLDELDGEGFSAQIKNLNKVEAKIRTLNRTAERLGSGIGAGTPLTPIRSSKTPTTSLRT